MGTRRRFTPEVNARVVLELISGVKRLADACREYQLKPQRLARWKGEFLDKVPWVFATPGLAGEDDLKPALSPARSPSERALTRSAFLSDADHDTMGQHFAIGWPGPREKRAQA
jgi:transposase-like protein